uniref:Major facilitator superfamily (MFS) profile domain-containing protein n=1 Tax=Eptatretus burgeri TaxID=7764 RepID=A0A8C4X0I4_EPTBU
MFIGLGCALCFSPTVALIGLHFPQRCSMTTGLAMSGNGVGTFILAPISQILVEVYTWRGDLLILGGLMAHTCICAAFLRPPPSTPSSPATQPCNLFGGNKTREVKAHNLCSKFVSWHWNSDSPLFNHEFILYIVAVSLLSYGCITPLLFVVTYAQENGVPDRHSAFLLSIIGILTIVGNVTYSWLMDSKCLSCYRVHAFAPIVCLLALNVLLLPVSSSYTFLIFCTVLFGYCNGASTIVIPIVAAKLVGPKRAPTAIGLVYFSHAIPYLIAPPISGRVIHQCVPSLGLMLNLDVPSAGVSWWMLKISWCPSRRGGKLLPSP